MSPSNFFATNPEALQLAAETGGQSVVEGMQLYFEDLAKGRVTMTDEGAFEVGKNIALSEGSVVFKNELIELIQYTPRTPEVHTRPLVIVPPCINKFYILDLQPENSFIRYALEQGHTVFVVSWRNAPPEIGHLTWDDYLELGVMQAIDVALDITGADRVNTLGFCIGGTLLATAVAVMSEWKEHESREHDAAHRDARLLRHGRDRPDGVGIERGVARAGDRSRRAAEGKGARVRVLVAARQRPDLAVRRQQLPQGQGAARLRHAVLEQ